MNRPRTIGVWPQANGSLVIVYPSQEAREGFRMITIPAGAVAVLRQSWGVVIQTPGEQLEVPVTEPQTTRTHVALAVVNEHPGLRTAAVCSEALYRLGLDEDDRKSRRQMMGLLNQLAERGHLVLDEEDRLWPAADEKPDEEGLADG